MASECGVRCLIVDDSATFLAAARTILERSGVAVVGTASSSAEALQCVDKMRPDVVLIDVDLGAESGFDLADRLHRTAVRPSMIMISTHAEEDVADMVAASPALGFVPKLALSARAIRDLMGPSADAADSVSETQGK
jgi:two-component system nitrate/nitrite response regulator NarL